MKLPILDKNAFLAIYVSKSSVYANLIYADYNSGRYYTLSDVLDLREDILTSPEFWKEYFLELEKNFNWDILRGEEIRQISAEGVGVYSATMFIDSSIRNSKDIVSSIRTVSHDIKYEFVNNEYRRDILAGICERMGYYDATLVNLDLFDFTVSRHIKEKETVAKGKREKTGSLDSGSIHWSDKKGLIDAIYNSKLRAFLSIDSSISKLTDIWANFVLSPSRKNSSKSIEDISRAYITVQLLSILNEHAKKFTEIGASEKPSLLILQGDLLSNLTIKNLLIAVLDGLEVRGEVDILIDPFSKVISLGKNFVLGIESSDFVVGKRDIFENVVKVFIPEIHKKEEKRKVVFVGSSQSEEEKKDIFALSPEFTFFEIGSDIEHISGKFIKGIGFGKEGIDVVSSVEKVKYLGIIVDARPKPIVYGPDAKSNKTKFVEWMNETN